MRIVQTWSAARRLPRAKYFALSLWLGGLLGLTACVTPPPPPLPMPPPPLGAQAPYYQPRPMGSTLYVIVPHLNLRACPAINCQILSTLSQGQALMVLGEQGGWLMVRVQASGRDGWVGGRYVDSQPMARPLAPRRGTAPSPAPAPPSEEWAEPSSEPPAEAPAEEPAPPVQEEFAPAAPR